MPATEYMVSVVRMRARRFPGNIASRGARVARAREHSGSSPIRPSGTPSSGTAHPREELGIPRTWRRWSVTSIKCRVCKLGEGVARCNTRSQRQVRVGSVADAEEVHDCDQLDSVRDDPLNGRHAIPGRKAYSKNRSNLIGILIGSSDAHQPAYDLLQCRRGRTAHVHLPVEERARDQSLSLRRANR